MMPKPITIDKHVPLPSSARPGPPNKYPWDGMKPGDSFFIPNVNIQSTNGLAMHRKSRYGWVIRRKTMIENGVKGVRIWRVA